MGLRQDVRDRLWHAYARWQEVRATGATKHDLKMRGIREYADPNHFVALAEERGITRLENIGKREFRDFMDHAIERGLAAKTLLRMSSALVKLGCLVGRSASYIALGARYADTIRQLAESGAIAGPDRATPSSEVACRTVAILREWDTRHWERTDEPRAYQLVARLQLETGCRRISATARMGAASLRRDNRIALSGKGGRVQEFTLSPELHRQLSLYLGLYGGRLADPESYRAAFARAVEAAGGRVTGTHGLRRLSAQEFYGSQYRAAVGEGLSPGAAAERAEGDAIARLGHSRNRADHRHGYLGR